jgi:hypothetical protein
MKTKLLVFAIAVCMIATSVRANMFDFQFDDLTSMWDGTSGFSMTVNPSETSGSLTRIAVPTATAYFLRDGTLPGFDWSTLGGNFSLSMTITSITGTGTVADPFSATGVGSFAITDITGDVISGNATGTWSRLSASNDFDGVISNVSWANNSGDGNFDGHLGSASMAFSQPTIQWSGSLRLDTREDNWFGQGAYTTDASSVEAEVVPVPAAVLLGVLGLGVAGLKLRKFS